MSNTNSQLIDLEKAAALTTAYQNTIPQQNGQFTKSVAFVYYKEELFKILDQEECEGVRIYPGYDENENLQLVIVGIDQNGDDMYQGFIMDKGRTCPQICSQANPLFPL
jgi:hypothetical protein